jgi:uncharacterized protein (DUF2249 family)
MTISFVDVDARPVLRAGGEPFSLIMGALETLEPGQGLRLFATFKPFPLFGVMQQKGFSHEAIELDGGEWEVLFRPLASVNEASPSADAADDGAWPNPVIELDNRDLDPPEPMVRILQAVEKVKAGEVVSALLSREPMFLFPELAKRGHQWRGAFDAEGTTYRIQIRTGTIKGRAA